MHWRPSRRLSYKPHIRQRNDVKSKSTEGDANEQLKTGIKTFKRALPRSIAISNQTIEADGKLEIDVWMKCFQTSPIRKHCHFKSIFWQFWGNVDFPSHPKHPRARLFATIYEEICFRTVLATSLEEIGNYKKVISINAWVNQKTPPKKHAKSI